MLLGRLYFRLADWEHLAGLLPKLKKHGRIDADTLTRWTLRVHEEDLDQAGDGDAVLAVWKSVARKHKNDIGLLEHYYQSLIRVGMHDKAEKDIATDLRREWRAPLVRLYGIVDGKDATRQLKKAESWLNNHGEDADLNRSSRGRSRPA